MSVISLRCELTWDRIIESAVGLIISRRCRWIVTMETWTGAVTPTPGRISTFPSNRGWTRVSTCSQQESPPSLLREMFHVPVSPICQDIQLRNYYSGFPTPAHWLMPFAQSLSPHWALRPSLGASPAGIARQVGGRGMCCSVRRLCGCVLHCAYSGPDVVYALAVGQSSAFV